MKEYRSGFPFPSPKDLPNPGIELKSPTLQVDSIPAEPQEKPYMYTYVCIHIDFCVEICMSLNDSKVFLLLLQYIIWS